MLGHARITCCQAKGVNMDCPKALSFMLPPWQEHQVLCQLSINTILLPPQLFLGVQRIWKTNFNQKWWNGFNLPAPYLLGCPSRERNKTALLMLHEFHLLWRSNILPHLNPLFYRDQRCWVYESGSAGCLLVANPQCRADAQRSFSELKMWDTVKVI